MKKFTSVIVLTAMILTLCLAGCQNSKNSSSNEGSATKSTTTNTSEEKKKENMKLWMVDCGLPHPDGVDPSNNEFINIIEKVANVDLTVEVPAWNDAPTKFNLMLSSSTLPDLVFTHLKDEAVRAAQAGAFIDLSSYYNNSDIIQRYITPSAIELAKTNDGKIYRIPMPWDKAPSGAGIYARQDLVFKYNNNKWPETVEQWIEVLRAIKNNIPDSVPITAHGGFFDYGSPIFSWYGVPLSSGQNGTRVQNGKIIPNISLPEYRAAIETMRMLYSEGIIDKELPTNDQPTRHNRIVNNNVVLVTDTADQLIGTAQYYVKTMGMSNEKAQFVFTPNLKKYPDIVSDAKYTYGKKFLPIIDHGIYISSSCKATDRAWDVIEAFASDELYEAIFWGKEDSEYTVTNGKRVPNTEKLNDPSRKWSLHLAIIFSFTNGQDVQEQIWRANLGDKYVDTAKESLKQIAANADVAGVSVWNLLEPITDEEKEADKKRPEAYEFEKQAAVRAVLGQITMEEFDAQVAEFMKKYSFIFEAYTKQLQKRKNEFITKGCVEAGW